MNPKGSPLRTAALALVLAAPSFAALLALLSGRRIEPAPAFAAAAFVLAFAALFASRFERGLRALARAIEALARDPNAVLEEKGKGFPALFALPSLALLRAGRRLKGQSDEARSGLALFEKVFAAVPGPLILIDEGRRMLRANAAALPFVGPLSEPRDLASALRNPALLEAVERVLRGAQSEAVEFAVFLPLERQLRARIARIEGPAPVAVLALDDMSEIKHAEEMRVDFVANASHELRNPLAALIGFIETLEGPAREDSEARERFLAIMSKEASRMARLVADLLSLSKIEESERVPPQGLVDIAPILRETVEAFSLRAGERGMTIRLDIPAELPEIEGDPDELAQVFQNLLDNAIKYARAGSEIALDATLARKRPPAAAGEKAYLAIAVKDQGEGIPRHHLPRLTERFYRVDPARSRALGGTGLGLAIVKHSLNRHRGFLEIESEPEKGSMFTVYLPLAEEKGAEETARPF